MVQNRRPNGKPPLIKYLPILVIGFLLAFFAYKWRDFVVQKQDGAYAVHPERWMHTELCNNRHHQVSINNPTINGYENVSYHHLSFMKGQELSAVKEILVDRLSKEWSKLLSYQYGDEFNSRSLSVYDFHNEIYTNGRILYSIPLTFSWSSRQFSSTLFVFSNGITRRNSSSARASARWRIPVSLATTRSALFCLCFSGWHRLQFRDMKK